MTVHQESPWGIDEYDVPEYLLCIGQSEAVHGEPSAHLLRDLHRAHVETLPFSNVQVLLGDHPGVSPSSVQASLITNRRGGYCFEHAQLFSGVLERLGFDVRRSLGRVGSPSNTRTHMTVVVTIDEVQYLCDPGFGFSVREPMPLIDGRPHVEGDREFTAVRHTETAGQVWELRRDGEPQHFSDGLPVVPVDVHAGHLTTSRDGFGPFMDHLMVMRHTTEGHVTVTEEARTVRRAGRPTRRERLSPEATIDAVQELGVRITDPERATLIEQVAEMRRS